MSLSKQISRLKNLENINPDKKWEKTTKYDLLEEISSQNRLMQAYKLSTAQKVDLFAMRVANRLAPSMRRVLAAFLVFMMFFGINIAAQASVPGEALWPVKRSIEEAELSLTFSTVKKTEVHIKHVNERLEEIDKILEKPADVSVPEVQEKKQKAIKQAVTHLEKDVNSVDSSLKIVKEESKALEVVELVKKVTDATKEVDTKLEEKKKAVDIVVKDPSLTEAINEAKVVNKKVKKAAVSVALEVHEEVTKQSENKNVAVNTNIEGSANVLLMPVSPSTGSTTDTDLETTTPKAISVVSPETLKKEFNEEEIKAITNIVKEIVASEIDDISVEVKDVKQKVEIVADEEIQKIKQDNLQNTSTKKDVNEEELQEIDDIKKESQEEADVVLQEAQVLLDSGMLKDAFEKVSEVQAKYEKAEATLQKMEKVKAESQLQQDISDSINQPIIVNPIVDNSSSTDNNASSTVPGIEDLPNTASSTPVVENNIEDPNTVKESGIEPKV